MSRKHSTKYVATQVFSQMFPNWSGMKRVVHVKTERGIHNVTIYADDIRKLIEKSVEQEVTGIGGGFHVMDRDRKHVTIDEMDKIIDGWPETFRMSRRFHGILMPEEAYRCYDSLLDHLGNPCGNPCEGLTFRGIRIFRY